MGFDIETLVLISLDIVKLIYCVKSSQASAYLSTTRFPTELRILALSVFINLMNQLKLSRFQPKSRQVREQLNSYGEFSSCSC